MRWIILAYLILNPLFFLVNFDQRDAQQMFFQLSSITVFAFGMFFPQRELKFSKLNAAIGCLLLIFVYAWVRTLTALPSLGAPRWYIAMNFIFGLLVYFTIIRTFKIDDIKFVFKGLGYFTAFCVFVLALQFLNYDIRGTVIYKGIPKVPIESIFFQKTAMGMYFAQNIPILLSLSSVWFLPVGLLIFIPMIWAWSSAVYFGAMGASLFFFWFRKRVIFWVLILGCVSGGILLLIRGFGGETKIGSQVRLPLWGIVIQDIFKYPLGYGLDSFFNPINENHWKYFMYYEGNKNHKIIKGIQKGDLTIGLTQEDRKYFKKVVDSEGSLDVIDHPHNEYLWLGYEAGVGALLVLSFIFYFIWERFKFSKRDVLTCASMGVLICLAIESFLQFPFHLARVGHILPVILGFFYLTTEE